MDCAVIPLKRHSGLSLVQTVDFFYPLTDNPKIMGQIALANVVSDIYAVGVTNIDNLSLIISSPTEFTDKQRDVIIPLIVEGFQEAAKKASCRPTIRNIAINPWCIIGGIASAVCTEDEIIQPSKAQIGDVIVLTKPLGTQLATNAEIWRQEKNDKYKQLLSNGLTEDDINSTFEIATKSMICLNRTAASLMHKYSAHAATDVTGFGLLGHAKNLAEFQKESLSFLFNKLPIINNVRRIGEILNQHSKLLNGQAVETSGGLLICMTEENANDFCVEYKQLNEYGIDAWIIGRVVAGGRDAKLLKDDLEIIDVVI